MGSVLFYPLSKWVTWMYHLWMCHLMTPQFRSWHSPNENCLMWVSSSLGIRGVSEILRGAGIMPGNTFICSILRVLMMYGNTPIGYLIIPPFTHLRDMNDSCDTERIPKESMSIKWMTFYCQALWPQTLCPKTPYAQVPISPKETGADTKIMWATNHLTPPNHRFKHEGGKDAMTDICDFQTKPDIEWRISVAIQQFFPGFPGCNSIWNFQ